MFEDLFEGVSGVQTFYKARFPHCTGAIDTTTRAPRKGGTLFFDPLLGTRRRSRERLRPPHLRS
jgi:hypothetical protein